LDTLTHAALGASIGEAFLGKKIGWKAAASGALIANIPDLDLIPALLVSPLEGAIIHRGITHSLLFCLLLGLLIGWMLARQFLQASFRSWSILAILTLLSHVLLDTCNVAGTQLFYPFINKSIIWGNIFFLDPLFTLPLTLGIVLAISSKRISRRKLWNTLGLTISGAYLILTFTNQLVADAIFTNALHLQGKSIVRKITTPTPLNTLLWYTVAESPSGYYVGICDVRDQDYGINFLYYPKNELLLTQFTNVALNGRLQIATQGYASCNPEGDIWQCHDMRMGIDYQGKPNYTLVIEKIDSINYEVSLPVYHLGVNQANLEAVFDQLLAR